MRPTFDPQNLISVDRSYTYIPYKDTGYFSHLVTDYLDNNEQARAFVTYAPSAEGLSKAIADRTQYPVDRKALVSVLNKQYAGLTKYDKVDANIALLSEENTLELQGTEGD